MGFCWQLHWEAWVRFAVLSTVAVLIYALYGQYHADPDLHRLRDSSLYQRASTVDDDELHGSTSNA